MGDNDASKGFGSAKIGVDEYHKKVAQGIIKGEIYKSATLATEEIAGHFLTCKQNQ